MCSGSNQIWCFTCDTRREGKVGDHCPICNSLLQEVLLKARLNVERLSYVGILILFALVSALLLPMAELTAPGDWTPSSLTSAETVPFVVLMITVLIVCSYLIVFFVGGYFGMTSGRALFTEYIPSEYPHGKTRRFSIRRLGIEALKSLGIMAGGISIFAILKFIRSYTG